MIAEIAKELGILTVAVVTRPFGHEGKRINIAQEGLDHLKSQVDSLIVIPNDKLMTALGEDVTVREAFRAADNVLRDAVAGISEVVTRPGFINLDFADVKNVMSIMGMAMMGSARKDFYVGDDAQAVVGATATLEVRPQDAVLLAQAKSEGELSLSLRSYADTAGPSGATRAPQAAALTRNVRVYRGGTPETVVTP